MPMSKIEHINLHTCVKRFSEKFTYISIYMRLKVVSHIAIIMRYLINNTDA